MIIRSTLLIIIAFMLSLTMCSQSIAISSTQVTIPKLTSQVMKCHGNNTTPGQISRVAVACGNFLKPPKGGSLNWLCPPDNVIVGMGSIDRGSWQKCNCDWYGCSTCWTPTQSCFIQCSPAQSPAANCKWE
jgi:hypothetical protein